MALSQQSALAEARRQLPLPARMPHADRSPDLFGRSLWLFSWSEDAQITVAVTADTGEVVSFFRDHGEREPVWPDEEGVDSAAAQRVAERFIRERFPDRQTELAWWPYASEYPDQWGALSPTYQFSWVRTIAGIPCPEQALTVYIDRRDGSVAGLTNNWAPELPGAALSSAPAISDAGAAAAFRGAGVDLHWRPVAPVAVRGPWDPVRRPERSEPIQWILAYRLRAADLWLDACSGRWRNEYALEINLEALLTRPLELAAGPVPSADAPSDPVTRAGALLGLPEGARLVTRPRPKRGREEEYEWEQGHETVTVRVDSRTGRVLEAHRHRRMGPSGRMVLSGRAGPGAPPAAPLRAAAVALVQRCYPDLLGHLGTPVPLAAFLPDRTDLFFPRLASGLAVGSDGVEVGLSPDGQWQAVSLTWHDGVPGQPQPAVSPDTAAERLLGLYDVGLVWASPQPVVPPLPGGAARARDGGPWHLVYRLLRRPDLPAAGDAVDAATGCPLAHPVALSSLDPAALARVPGGRAVLKLAANFALSEEEAANPGGPVTRAGALRLLVRWVLRGGSVAQVPYRDVAGDEELDTTVGIAVANGMLRPTGQAPRLHPHEIITRGEFACLAAGTLGCGPLLDSNVAITGPLPSDAGVMQPDVRRAVAILAALDLTSIAEAFRPDDTLTLGDAAELADRLAPRVRPEAR